MSEPTPDSKKIAKVQRNEKGQLLPGSILNPIGTVPGTKHLTTLLEEAIKRVGEGGTEPYDVLLVKRVLKKAIGDGDMRAIEHIWDRIEGKAPQTIANLNLNYDAQSTERTEELAHRLSRLLGR